MSPPPPTTHSNLSNYNGAHTTPTQTMKQQTIADFKHTHACTHTHTLISSEVHTKQIRLQVFLEGWEGISVTQGGWKRIPQSWGGDRESSFPKRFQRVPGDS